MIKLKRYAGSIDYSGVATWYFWTREGALKWQERMGSPARIYHWDPKTRQWWEMYPGGDANETV